MSILLNMDPGAPPVVVTASEGDIGRIFTFQLIKDGMPCSYPSATVTAEILKSDGHGTTIPCTWSGSEVVMVTTEQSTIRAGKANCELRISQGNMDIGTANFIMAVEPRPVNADTDQTDSSYSQTGNPGDVWTLESNGRPSWAKSGLDATTATAGQTPIADGAGGWAWGDVATSGDSVPTEVRQALFTLLNNAVYRDTDLTDEKAIIQSWATEITAISVSPSTLRMNGAEAEQLVATTQPAGGIITWESSDTSVAEVDGGLVTSIGNGTCTITARCGSKSATCAVTVTGFASLLSIEATYTQSGTVYDTDSLDDLKSDLVVMGTYSDERTLPITGYTLSGTLTVGTSTITVAYGGFTDTFTVTVSRAPVMPLYNWDLTSSLTDTVGGITATISNATFISGTGVVFSDAERQYLSFGQVYSRNRTYEIDVLEIGAATGTGHRRLLSFGANTAVSSGGACFLNTKTKGYGWKFYSGSAWDSRMIVQGTSSDSLYDYFDGKTVKIYLDSDGIASVYAKTIGADDSTYELVGTSGVALNDFENGIAVVGATYQDYIGPATITGFRVYNGNEGGE